MAYYDKIAKNWHSITGFKGGALKKHQLNDLILNKIHCIAGKSILEIGAGNGYFIPLMLKIFSGQVPSRIVVSDYSEAQLKTAIKYFRVLYAEYMKFNICLPFPFDENEFDIILSTMVFNEVSRKGLKLAFKECSRVLKNQGVLIATVLHPEFIDRLDQQGKLTKHPKGFPLMPGARGLQLPVFKRKISEYHYLLESSGFEFENDEVYPSKKVLNEKPALRKAGKVPIASIYYCKKK